MQTLHVQRASFRAEDIETHGMGAGIVPVSQDENGEYRFLLGRERFLPQWKGSCRWSGFEGARKGDESMRVAAAREFAEESLGVLGAAHAPHWVRIAVRILSERRAERYHATYVVPVTRLLNS